LLIKYLQLGLILRNVYSGLLLGLLLIFSSLFYGLALTNSDKKFQQHSALLDGTWRLIAVHQFDKTGKPMPSTDPSPMLQSLKIVANLHFSRVTTADDGRVLDASAGLIELTKERYYEYAGFKPDAQSRLTYQWQLHNGLLTQRRTDNDRVIEEIWQLVD
jgi:hypothetical protein